MQINGWQNFSVKENLLLVVTLWLTSLIDARLAVGKYGLIHSLPIVFFVATTLLTVSFLISLEHSESERIKIAHILLLVLFLYATPSLLEGTPQYLPAYHMTAEAEYVLKTGHSVGSELTYTGFPGLLYFVAEALSLSGLTTHTFMLTFPTLSAILFLPPGIMLLKRLTKNSNEAYLAIWVFYLMAWFQQQYVVPQNIGFILFTLSVGSFLLLVTAKSPNRIYYAAVVATLLASAAISHGLSAAMFPTILLGFVPVILLARLGRILMPLTRDKVMIALSTLPLVIMLTKLVFSLIPRDTPSLCVPGSPVCLEILRPDLLLGQVDWFLVVSTIAGRTQVLLVRIVFLVLYLPLVIAGLVCLFRSKKERPFTRRLLLAWLVAVIALPVITSYAGEALLRSLLFGLLPSAALVGRLMSRRALKIYLIAFLLVAPALHIVANYGNQNIDYIRPMELREGNFLVEYTAKDVTIGALSTRAWVYTDLQRLPPSQVASHTQFGDKGPDYRGYFWISQKDINTWYQIHGGNPGLETYLAYLTRAVGANGTQIVYSNGYSDLYSRGT